MLLRLSLLALVGLALGAPGGAQTGVRVESRSVQMEAQEAVLRWTMQAEPGVTGYRVERRAAVYGNEQFMPVGGEIKPHGPGRGYEWRDTDLHKAAQDQIEYRVSAVFADHSTQTLFSEQINYTATAIRRTWGSLKALFQ